MTRMKKRKKMTRMTDLGMRGIGFLDIHQPNKDFLFVFGEIAIPSPNIAVLTLDCFSEKLLFIPQTQLKYHFF